MKLTPQELTDPVEIATQILAGAFFAADFCPIRDLMNPKSKIRLALERRASTLIEREAARVLLDADVLTEEARREYEACLETVRRTYGDAIERTPYAPPRVLLGEFVERAVAKGAFASARGALDHLGELNKYVGEMVASSLRDLKPAGSSSSSSSGTAKADDVPSLRSTARTLWRAVRLKNPLEPLFQARAVTLHFERLDHRDKLIGALREERHKEALEFCIDYLIGDREIADSASRAISNASIRKAYVREWSILLTGGDEEYGRFVSRYGKSVETFKGGGASPDLPAVQKALTGEERESADGITLLRALAVSCPVSSLVCRPVLVPREGYFLIPIIIGDTSALELLGIV